VRRANQGDAIMKSILLFANDDPGLESRLQAALDLARASGGHLTCAHATPYESFIMGDPFGGVYALPNVVEQLGRAEAEQRRRVEARLGAEGVSWDWVQSDGAPVQVVAELSPLADLVVVSLASAEGEGASVSLAADLAVHILGPVLAVPPQGHGFAVAGPAMVAWNGSAEAAHALRMALPLLRFASGVHIATVTEDDTRFPATDASRYLSRHGLASELIELAGDEAGAGDALLGCARGLDASCIVMGAYGHSRLREAVLGGVTRHMLRYSSIPLLLAH
jgi:nucleotide-binding universal stress UspA family protein